jgi:hypothetical protein
MSSSYYAVVNLPKGTYLAATDVDESAPGYRESAIAAQAIYDRLTDSRLLGSDPGLPAAKHVGCCRLCGQEAELTFEHFPPRSSGNNQRQRAYPFRTPHQAGEAEVGAMPTAGWISLQRGIGAAVLCDPCNTKRTGRRLVPAYSQFAAQAVELLAANTSIEDGRPHIPRTFRLTIEDSALGAIGRQALVMLMAVSGGAALTRSWPELYELVTSDDPGTLPVELALGVRLVVGNRSRASGHPVGQINQDGYRVYYEISSTPFSWNLSVGAPGEHPAVDGADVSHWLRWARTERGQDSVDLPVGIVITHYPGDFRNMDEALRQSEQLRNMGEAG